MTDTDLVAALSPIQRVGLTLWGEARGQREDLNHNGIPDLIEAIGSAVLNRVKAQHKAWGFTADEVCLKPAQFSCWNLGTDHNHLAVLDAARHLLRGEAVGPVLKLCLVVAAEVCTGTLKDSVAGGTHYYSPAGMKSAGRVPPWAVGIEPVAIVGGTRFYRTW